MEEEYLDLFLDWSDEGITNAITITITIIIIIITNSRKE